MTSMAAEKDTLLLTVVQSSKPEDEQAPSNSQLQTNPTPPPWPPGMKRDRVTRDDGSLIVEGGENTAAFATVPLFNVGNDWRAILPPSTQLAHAHAIPLDQANVVKPDNKPDK